MSKTLEDIAKGLENSSKKVQLVYGFNGIGKTRLSREFKQLIAPKNDDADMEDRHAKMFYYNAFTEDLFYWDNDLESDTERKLKIQPNAYTRWVLQEQGQDLNAITHFQRYTSDKLTPRFNEEYKIKDTDGKEITVPAFSEVTFSIERGDNESLDNLKISKGEESIFIWSIFYTLLDQIMETLDIPEVDNRETGQFNKLKYIFIDDPVCSLDENHLIELAVNLAVLVKNSTFANGQGVKFVITTHSPLFYNVLHNELNNDLYKTQPDGTEKCVYKRGQSEKYRLDKKPDGTFQLIDRSNDHPFSYHLFLLSELRKAINNDQINKYHFNFLRNILEKTATFLGYKKWSDLLPRTEDGAADRFANRILNLSSHSAHAGEEVAELEEHDKEKLIELVTFLTKQYGFSKEEE